MLDKGEKRNLAYVTGFGLFLLYIKLGLIKVINQEEMSLEKYEDFLELSIIKQFVIQSSPIFLGHKYNQTITQLQLQNSQLPR